MLQLSEHLYPLDEVVISLIQSVISRRTVKECLYWLLELHSSVDTTSDSLLCLYHLFFAVRNQGLDGYIHRKLRSFASTPTDITPLADIVCALRISKPSLDTYLIWLAATSESLPTRVFKAPPTTARFAGLIRSICRSDLSNVGAYLRVAASSAPPCRIIDDLVSHFGIPVLQTSECSEPDLIYACAMAACSFPQGQSAKAPSNFARAPPRMVEEMVGHFKSAPQRAWSKLAHRRLYPTHTTVLGRPHGGTYARYDVEDLALSCWHSWEYYCYDSRLWRQRFERYGGIRNESTRSVAFPDDDLLEAFYDNGNAMDFDEQPAETQSMSLHPLEVIAEPSDWFQRQIDERLCVHLAGVRI